jgi:branched-chain amino acid aminotransferase
LLNERDEIAECTAAKVFCIRGGSVETPPLSSGCLPGVTRDVLLEIGRQFGPPVKERSLTLAKLQQADEVFISSTSREILPVGQIEDHKVPQAHGPVTTRLAKAFSEYVIRYLARSPMTARP